MRKGLAGRIGRVVEKNANSDQDEANYDTARKSIRIWPGENQPEIIENVSAVLFGAPGFQNSEVTQFTVTRPTTNQRKPDSSTMRL